MPSKLPSIIGAGLALLAFLFVGLLPAVTYGGYAGLLLARGILGGPVDGGFVGNALIVFGSVLGVSAIAALFAVTGAAMGAAVGVLVSLGSSKKEEPAPVKTTKAA